MRVLLLVLTLGLVAYAFGGSYLERAIKNGSTAALLITGINKGELESVVLEHYRTSILRDDTALQNQDDHTVTLAYTNVDQDDLRDVIAQVESKETCGSGGCITTIFLQNDIRGFDPIDFSYAAHDVEVLDTVTRGMHDLRINGDTTSRMVWDGTKYALESL